MKPAPFEYHAPESAPETAALLHELGDDAKILAGGQSLVPIMALRMVDFGHVVDVNRVNELRGTARQNGSVRVAAMSRQTHVERDPLINASVPLLAKATPFVGHFQIRNRGTVGGSLAHADPAAEYPAVALALDATFEVRNHTTTRMVSGAEFFVSSFTTALDAEDLLAAVHFPVWEGRCGFAVDEVARRLGDFALTGAACAIAIDAHDRVDRVGVAMFGMGSTPLRASAAEAALSQQAVNDVNWDEIGQLAAGETDPPSDVHATADYRRKVGGVIVARALRAAAAEASRG